VLANKVGQICACTYTATGGAGSGTPSPWVGGAFLMQNKPKNKAKAKGSSYPDASHGFI